MAQEKVTRLTAAQGDAHRVAATAALLMIIIFWVYAPVFHADFVDYDDPLYVTENTWVREGLTWPAFQKAWTERVAGNWHPITMLSHLIDVQLFGLDPRGHHAVSLLIHALNALLLFVLFRGLFGGLFRPAVAALLFALHPFNVDSVAWVAERKNVLSTFFWLAATVAYVRFTRRPSVAALLGVHVAYLLGLMTKPMLVTFPITLLMLDLWPLRRVSGISRSDWPQWIKRIQEKSALFLFTVLFSVFTLVTQFPHGYEHAPLTQPWWGKMLFALEHYQMYLQKFFWPAGMSVFYPRLEMPPDLGSALLAGLLLVAITAGCLWARRRAPASTFGWFWFAGTMFPVIGIIGIGQHSIADRYMYVPMIGLLIAVVWSWPVGLNKGARIALGILGIAAVAACASVTRATLPHWQNSEALFRRAVEATEGNYTMLSNLGRQLILQKRVDEAMAQFREALRINPRHVKSLNNLGFALALQGLNTEAIPYYEKALRHDPGYAIARINLARSLMPEGRYREALEHYDILMKINPDSAEVREGWRVARQALGMPTGWMP